MDNPKTEPVEESKGLDLIKLHDELHARADAMIHTLGHEGPGVCRAVREIADAIMDQVPTKARNAHREKRRAQADKQRLSELNDIRARKVPVLPPLDNLP